MPTYQFHCLNCDEHFERILTMRERDDAPLPRCPTCRSEAVERLFSSFYAKTAKKS